MNCAIYAQDTALAQDPIKIVNPKSETEVNILLTLDMNEVSHLVFSTSNITHCIWFPCDALPGSVGIQSFEELLLAPLFFPPYFWQDNLGKNSEIQQPTLRFLKITNKKKRGIYVDHKR
jgi:hypothetical protein